MRKILFSIVTLLALAAPFTSQAEMRWGVTAGAIVSDLKWSQPGFHMQKFSSDQSLGYSAGIIGEYEIPGIGFGIDLGLQYAQRGATMNLGDFPIWQVEGYGTERSYLHYLDIPIHVRFKYTNLQGFERKLAPFAFVGPTMSILLAHNDIKAYDYKRVNLGIEVGAGAEIFRNFQLSCSYTWDVTGTSKTVMLSNFNSKSRNWKVALTYFF